jgi:hypothetical protein
MVLDIAIFAMLAFMSARIIRAMRQEGAIRAEFGLGPELFFFVPLLPLGPVVLLLGAFLVPFPLAQVLALACFAPTLFYSRRHARMLETAGTDRVRDMQSLLSQAFGSALAGTCFVIASMAISYGARVVGGDA